jgi:hypothetical protein
MSEAVGPTFLVCVPWGEHSIPSVQRVCVCGTAIAISNKSLAMAEAMEMIPICTTCGRARLAQGEELGGGFVNGVLYGNVGTALRAMRALLDRN